MACLLLFAFERSCKTAIEDEASVQQYTHYDYLDLPPGASPSRIDAAYHVVLERFGDGGCEGEGGGPDFSAIVREIHAAYQALSNPQTRSAYDQKLAQEAAIADAELKAALDRQALQGPQRVQDAPPALERVLRELAA